MALERRLRRSRLDADQGKEQRRRLRLDGAGPAHPPRVLDRGGRHRVGHADLAAGGYTPLRVFCAGGEEQLAGRPRPCAKLGLPRKTRLRLLAVLGKHQRVDHHGVAARALDQRATPIGDPGAGHLGRSESDGSEHVALLQRSIHGDARLHEPVDPGDDLVEVVLQERVAGQAQLQYGKRVVRVARGPVEAVQEDEISAGVGAAAETGEVKRLVGRYAALAGLPFGAREPVDGPFAHQVLRRFRRQVLFRPERLAQPKNVGIQSSAVAVVGPAAILGEVRRLMKKIEGR